MKKNNFLSFCFAFIPGAGQMYLGMMKRGTSLMLAFSIVTILSGFLYLPLLTALLPVLWFYAFFDTFHMKELSYEQRVAQDAFLFRANDLLTGNWSAVIKQRHMLIGGTCIVLGIYLLYQSLSHNLFWHFSKMVPWLNDLMRAFPSFIVAVAIIVLGVRLVMGDKKDAAAPSSQEEFVEYGGKQND